MRMLGQDVVTQQEFDTFKNEEFKSLKDSVEVQSRAILSDKESAENSNQALRLSQIAIVLSCVALVVSAISMIL